MASKELSSKELVSKDTVEKIANLARLELTNEEVSEYSKTLSAILGHFNELNELDTKNIEPLTTPTPIASRMREDIVKPFGGDILSNAPDKSGHLFKVPPVV